MLPLPRLPRFRKHLLALALAFASVAGPSLFAQWKQAPASDGSEFAAARKADRAAMREALLKHLFPGETPKPLPADLVVHRREDLGDHERWSISYTVDEGETANAYLLLPPEVRDARDGTVKRPLVVALHGTTPVGKERPAGVHPDVKPGEPTPASYLNREYGLEAVRQGYVVFAPDRAAYGSRQPLAKGTVKQQMAEAQRLLSERRPGWTLFGKQLWDLRRALDFLCELEFVDSTRIASMGHSLGAWDTVLLGALDDRVKAVIISHCGNLRFQPELWSDETALRNYLGRPRSINDSLNVYLMLLAPRHQLYFWSLEEPKDQAPNILEALRLVGEYNRAVAKSNGGVSGFSFYLHNSGHDFPPDSRALAWAWLAQRFGMIR